MNYSYNRAHIVFTAVLVVAASMVIACNGHNDDSREPLNWKQLEAALKAPEVRTVRDLFARLSKEPIRKQEKDYYSDLKKPDEDSMTLDRYLSTFYLQSADIQEEKEKGVELTPALARERLQKEITWKKEGATVDDVGRIYLLNSRYPTKAERRLHWDKIVYFHVFADDSGNLLGWIKPSHLEPGDNHPKIDPGKTP